MDVRAIVFDVNGTLIDISTEDDAPQIFRAAGHFLSYQGVELRRHEVRDLYFRYLKEQQKASAEEFPEYNAPAIWQRIIDEHATDYTHSLPATQLAELPLLLAQLARGVSRHRLRPYPHAIEVLDA